MSHVRWSTLVGDREENDIVVDLHLVWQNVVLGVNTNTHRFALSSGTDGNIYRLDLTTGTLLSPASGFGATLHHSALAMYSFYQVPLHLPR